MEEIGLRCGVDEVGIISVVSPYDPVVVFSYIFSILLVLLLNRLIIPCIFL